MSLNRKLCCRFQRLLKLGLCLCRKEGSERIGQIISDIKFQLKLGKKMSS